MARHIALLVAVLVAATGCGPNPATTPTPTATKKPGGGNGTKGGGTDVAPSTKPAPVVPGLTTKVKLPEGLLTRVVDPVGPVTTLTGKVKLISDHGGALISNNSGNIIANNGGGLISDAGGGLIANNGGGVIANNGGAFKLKQAEAPKAGEESTLAEATVFVVDAAGRALVGKDGQPIAAVSDGQGGYKIQANLPAENLVLKVRLWNGGELGSMLPRGEAAAREVPIDTASTLGAAYVLDKFVKGDQKTFDKLPQAETDRLWRDLAAVRGLIGKTPDYQPSALVALTDELRAKAPDVDKTLTDIKALLLGQANLGSGRNALEVPLADPRATVPDGPGFLIAEGILGRIRRVSADGTLTTYVDQLHGEIKQNFYACLDMARAADGTLYVLSGKNFGVTRVKPDGTVEDVAGTGMPGRTEAGKPGTQVTMRPWSLALDDDGTVLIGEDDHEHLPPRVLALGADGVVREVAPPAWVGGRVVGLARATDGALYVMLKQFEAPDGIWRLPKGGTTWTKLPTAVNADKQSDLAADPQGGVFITEDLQGLLSHVDPDGTKKVLTDGKAGSPLLRPTDISCLPDGRLRVIEGAGIRVYEVDRAGKATVVAGKGALGADAAGDQIALNGPFGVAFAPDGTMHISEIGAHAMSKWNGKELIPLGGGIKGRVEGGVDVARYDTPTGIAFRGDEMLINDMGNFVLRGLGKDGTVRTVAGSDFAPEFVKKGETLAKDGLHVGDGAHVITDGADNAYLSMMGSNQVVRLSKDDQWSLVVGTGKKGSAGDGGEAADAELSTPLGLAFGPDGALYLADSANMRIRRIKDAAGPKPTIEAYAGLDGAAAFAALANPPQASEKLADAAFAFPSGICFDKAGNLYVAEFGTLSLRLLAGLSPGVRDLPLDLLPKVPARVRKIAPDGTVTVVAGPGGKFFADAEAGDALVLPTDIKVDPQGRLVIVDVGANLIRFIPAGTF